MFDGDFFGVLYGHTPLFAKTGNYQFYPKKIEVAANPGMFNITIKIRSSRKNSNAPIQLSGGANEVVDICRELYRASLQARREVVKQTEVRENVQKVLPIKLDFPKED